jgi:hypothetical protein
LIKEYTYLIEESKELESQIRALKSDILDEVKPNIFDPRSEENIVFQHEIGYETLVLSFAENGIDIRDFTVFQVEVAIKKNQDDIKAIRSENK